MGIQPPLLRNGQLPKPKSRRLTQLLSLNHPPHICTKTTTTLFFILAPFMAAKLLPCLLSLLLLLFFLFIPFSSCQSDSPLNIETFYPSPANPNQTQIFPPPPSPLASLQPPPPPTAPVPASNQHSASNRTVAKAVAATAATTFVVSALLFFLIRLVRRRRDTGPGGSQAVASAGGGDEFRRFDGNLKGLIVDENGLDVLYWRKLELIDHSNSGLQKSVFHGPDLGGQEKEEEEEEKEIIYGGNQRIQEIPLIRVRSSSSHNKVAPEVDDRHRITAPPAEIALQAIQKSPPRPPLPSKSMPPPVPSKSAMSVPKSQSAAPSPSPTVASKSAMSATKNQSAAQPPPPPPPPPVPGKKNQAPTPPPPRPISTKKPMDGKALEGASKVAGESSLSREGIAGSGNGQVKLRPLHWDKLKPNGDHSMVWDKIDSGSFR